MKTVTATEVKSNFSNVLVHVRKGEQVKVLFGRAKIPVALNTPIYEKPKTRTIGILNGKATFTEQGDGKITEEEFLGL